MSFKKRPLKVFTKLYTAVVQPHLDYAAEVWNSCLRKLTKSSKRCKGGQQCLYGRSGPNEERLRRLDLPTTEHRTKGPNDPTIQYLNEENLS